MQTHVVILGLPGSGKTTQADLLSRNFGMDIINTGTLISEEIDSESDIGKRAEEYLGKSEHTPDNDIMAIIQSELNKKMQKNKLQGIIFDGFPRTLTQAKFLDQFLKKHNTKISFAFLLEVDEKISKKRIKELRAAYYSGVKKGEEDPLIDKGFLLEKKHLSNVADHYSAQNILYPYPSDQDKETIQWAISSVVEKKLER